MPVIVLPAHVPVFPAAGVFAGNVLVTPGTTATDPFTGFLVMFTVTGSETQLRSQARSCATRVSTPDSADRVSVSSWANANAAPISEAIRQASETAGVRISAPPLQPSFPRDDINDSRRRGSNGSHRRAAERLSLCAPNQCALVLRPKNLCDSVTLLGIGECAMNFTGGLILIAIGIVMLFFGRARKGEQLRIFRVWIVGQLYAMTAMTLGVFGVAALIVNWPF